jgi:uncharacterized membrane protein YdjX (TVP38/TMEM64 family)
MLTMFEKPIVLLQDRRLWLILAVLAAIAGLHLMGFDRYLSFEVLKTHRRELVALVENYAALAAVLYVAIYVVVVALSLPGALFLTLAGGFLFGSLCGAILTVISATTGATLVFLMARSAFGDASLDRFGPQARRLAENIRANAWSYLLVLRLVPLFPFFVVNIIPALVGVRPLTFMLTTFFGIMPGTAVYSLAGAGLGSALEQDEVLALGTILTPEIIAGLAGLAALALAAIPLRKWIQKRSAGLARD